jgi:hypothetical protein
VNACVSRTLDQLPAGWVKAFALEAWMMSNMSAGISNGSSLCSAAVSKAD